MENSLRSFASSLSITLPEKIFFDGKIHRFNPQNGSHRGDAGWYICRSDGDIGWGTIGDWSCGIKENWFSGRVLTKEIKKRIRSDAAASERERKASQKKCAEKAREIWDNAIPKNHPYLKHKKIKLHNSRVFDDALIIPIFNDELVSIQKIYADGEKSFLYGTPITGSWSLIEAEDYSKIIVCEGWATGATCHEATGLPVYIGWSAGNLVHCAIKVRERHPDAEIIIAADQDAWDKKNSSLRLPEENIGQIKAKEAAAAAGAIIKTIPAEKAGVTDFNDWAALKGLDSVREIFEASPILSELPKIVKIDGKPFVKKIDWRNNFLLNADGDLRTNSFANAALVLENEFPERYRYNSLAKVLFRDGKPITDKDETEDTIWLEREYGITITEKNLHSLIVAQGMRLTYNPVVDYLNGLKWDGVKRAENMLQDFLGVEDNLYTRAVSKRFLISAVARALKRGCKVDTVLVLEGSQGKKRKSTFIRNLFGDEFFSDSMPDIKSKDASMIMCTKWCFEIAELDAIEKKDSNSIKTWISKQSEHFRPPYGRNIIEEGRPCVFVGTTNEETYLKDQTGGRRFWPVKCKEFNHESLVSMRDQIWAEAVALFKKGEQWWLTEEEEAYAEQEQEERLSVDLWQEIVIEYIGNKNIIQMPDLLTECLLIPREKWSKSIETRVGFIMRNLGFERKRRRAGAERTYTYEKKNDLLTPISG